MYNENTLIVFIALAALAIVIQASLVAGLYLGLLKANRQLKHAIAEARRLTPDIPAALERAESASAKLTRATASFARR
ncbi:MAG TPA: hypothetical protein VFY29_17330 [Terriglobia bacterium]|nr:hypothetical protein [Terriglobia bacterium]